MIIILILLWKYRVQLSYRVVQRGGGDDDDALRGGRGYPDRPGGVSCPFIEPLILFHDNQYPFLDPPFKNTRF